LCVCVCMCVCVTLKTQPTDSYSPALKATAKKLHMSEHLAGVTLLAFGNSTSDLIAYMKSSGMSTLFTYMVSNAIFITLISGGLVCVLWPTQLHKYETVRTMLFFILSVIAVEFMLVDTSISTKESTCNVSMLYYPSVFVLCMYVLYLGITIAEDFMEAADSVIILETKGRRSNLSSNLFSRATIMRGTTQHRDLGSVDVEATRFADFRAARPKNDYLLDGFVESIQPIDEDFWSNSGILIRIALIVLSPLMLFALLLIPMVDLSRRRHGWSKLLNCSQVVITPLYACIILNLSYLSTTCTDLKAFCSHSVFYQINPMFLYHLCFTVPLAGFIFKISRTDMPPPFHFAFVIISAIGSIMMLYVCTTETNEVLKVGGLILGLSNNFIAATISSWGSSVCTIVINVILAHHGYAAMAFTASYAGPFFNFIIAMGVLPIYGHFANISNFYSRGMFTLLSYVFLMISLIGTLIWLLLFNFYGRRSVGVYSILIYFLYVTYCVLCEKEIIHSYADDVVFDVV
ncbi:hypothetical protein KR222_008058, partial [Zaprionus bogoriensis]